MIYSATHLLWTMFYVLVFFCLIQCYPRTGWLDFSDIAVIPTIDMTQRRIIFDEFVHWYHTNCVRNSNNLSGSTIANHGSMFTCLWWWLLFRLLCIIWIYCVSIFMYVNNWIALFALESFFVRFVCYVTLDSPTYNTCL